MVIRILLVLLILNINLVQGQSYKKNNDTSLIQMAESNNTFALRLYKNIIQSKDKNLVFSPLSFSTAFSMLYAGSKKNTEKEIKNVFGFQENDSLKHHKLYGEFLNKLKKHQNGNLHIANALWLQKKYSFLLEYQRIIEQCYKSDIFSVDFSDVNTHKRINDWGKKNSKGILEKILQSYSTLFKVVINNIALFDAKWEKPFNASNTKNGIFYTQGTQVSVPFMQEDQNILYRNKDSIITLGLLYKEYVATMIILMPLSDAKMEFLEKNLDKYWNEQISKNLDTEKLISPRAAIQSTYALVRLPKFKIDTKLADPISTMIKMGVKDAFNDNADFSRITENKAGLQVQVLEHVCKMECDEAGTQIAAATSIAMVERGGSQLQVKIDRPFIFMIIDNESTNIMFMGKVNDPSK
ncbi:MAG: serpin family protein [Raineya sp.]|jgi:serpin B|nr:serpin family protein [Raineya sp.]